MRRPGLILWQMNESKGDCTKCQANDHERNAQEKYPASTNTVDELEGNQGKYKVSAGDGKRSGDRIVEPDHREDGGREVH